MRRLKAEKPAAPRRAAAPRKTRKRRNSLWQRWRKRFLIGSLSVSMIGGLAGTVGWAWYSGWIERSLNEVTAGAIAMTQDAGFEIREVYVRDRTEISSTSLIRALDVQIGDPMLTFDPEAARERLEALGWIRSARVERHFPDRLVVTLKERRPAAIWQDQGRFSLIDINGVEIGDEGIDRFGHLKVVVGTGAPEQVSGLLRVLAEEPELREQVTAAVWIGNRRWNLKMHNGIDIRLPEKDALKAWRKLAKLEKEHGLFEREIQAIDLRQPDRLVVRVTEKGRQVMQDVGDET